MQISTTSEEHIQFFLDVSFSSSPAVLGRQSLCKPSYRSIFWACFFLKIVYQKEVLAFCCFRKAAEKLSSASHNAWGGVVPEVGG